MKSPGAKQNLLKIMVYAVIFLKENFAQHIITDAGIRFIITMYGDQKLTILYTITYN